MPFDHSPRGNPGKPGGTFAHNMNFRTFCKAYALDPSKAESAYIYQLWVDSLPVYTKRELEEIGNPRKIGDLYYIEVDEPGFQFLSLLFVILGALIYAVCF